MSRRLIFETLYRLGRPVWDTPPPDVGVDVAEACLEHILEAVGEALRQGEDDVVRVRPARIRGP